MKYNKQDRHSWTKEEIKSIIKLWDTSTPDELADEIGIKVKKLMYMVHLIRNKGFKLTKKRRAGTVSLLIEEAIKEMR